MSKESANPSPHLALNHLFRWQFGSSIYMSLLQVISIVLLGRFLGYKELGIYTIFQLIFRFAVSVFEPGMFVSIIQKAGFNRTILWKEKKIQYVLVSIGMVLLLCFFAIEKNYVANNASIVMISILLFALIGFFSHYPALLTRQLKQKEISIAQISGSTFEFIFIISSIWFISPLLVFSGGLFIRFIIYYAMCRYYLSNLSLNEDSSASIEEHVHFSGYQLVNQTLSFVQGNFDTVLVGSVFGLSVLGPYNFASEISYLLFSKINPIFNKAIFPVLSRFQDKPSYRQHIISESLLSHALICLSFYLVLYFNIEQIIPLIAKDPEGLILSFARFILIMAMIRSVNNVVFNQLLSLGESKNLLKWNIAVLIINYTFIALIYITGTPILKFLFINIFVSLSVLVYSSLRLRSYYEVKNLFEKQFAAYLIYFITCIVFLFIINYLEFHFAMSILLGCLVILILNMIYYRQKMSELFRFRII